MSAEVIRLLESALELHAAGDLAGAERQVRKALQRAPRQPDALQVAGMIYASQGRMQDAAEAFSRAVEARPDDPANRYNLAQALGRAGRDAEALPHLEALVRLAPREAEARFLLALTLATLGRPGDAIVQYDAGLALDPRSAVAWFNRGNALRELGRPGDAARSYARALELEPSLDAARLNHAVSLRESGLAAQALEVLDALLERHPASEEAWINRGNVLRDLGQDGDAIAAFRRAVELVPEGAQAWTLLGAALRDRGDLDGALEAQRRAVALDPSRADAWLNLGNALSASGRAEEALQALDASLARSESAASWRSKGAALCELQRAEEGLLCFERATALEGSDPLAWVGRGNACILLKRFDAAAAAFSEAIRRDPEVPFAAGARLYARMMACDWDGLDADQVAVERAVARGVPPGTPFQLLCGDFPRQTLRANAELYVRLRFPPAEAAPVPRPMGEGLRVGYFSPDLRDHVVGYNVLALLRCHDRSRVTPVGLSLREAAGDPIQARMRREFGEFLDLGGLSGPDMAARIREAALDVLVDLTGHTDGSRMDVLARRVAPVQVNLLCPTTSGAPYLDYFIADRQTVPDAHHDGYTESVATIPVPFFVTDYREWPVIPGARREDEGLPEDAVVFACFCESYKITPGVWSAWMRILGQVPGSVLWLTLRNNPKARERLLGRAQDAGVDPGRLRFARPVADRQAHLSRLALADLCLDTPIYNGHTTTADALWSGVPVLTRPGTSFCGRIASSLVQSAGLPELVVDDDNAYVGLAVEIGRDGARRAALRERLAANRATSPMFDTATCVRRLEDAYAEMVARSRAGLAPAPFHLEG